MTFRTSGINFAKILWEEYRIKYGPKNSYCIYPRRYKTRGIRICCYTKISQIVDLELSVNTNSNGERWLHIEEGSVTGYESARLNALEGNPSDWYACIGTPKRWDTLIIKSKDLKVLLKEIKEGKTP